jgi:hypothetical protein
MQLDPAERRAVEIVDRVGWMVQHVYPVEGNSDPEWFSYTVGLGITHGWPELICFGLDPEVMGKMLNNAVSELKEKKIVPCYGLELDDVLELSSVKLGTFPRHFFISYLGWAIWFSDYRGMKPQQFACLQLTWPDKQGFFPTDPNCDPVVTRVQTPKGVRPSALS